METIHRALGRTRAAGGEPISGFLSRTAGLTCLFGSFAFLQFTVLGLANHAGEGYLSPEQRDGVYYALQVSVILGYVLFSCLFRGSAGHRARRAAAAGIPALLFFAVAVMLIGGTASLLNVIVSVAAALCVGGIGGMTHLRMSQAALRGTGVAACMGIGSAAAVALQYLLQIQWGVSPLLPVFMAAALFLPGLLFFRGLPEADPERDEPAEKTSGRQLLFAVLIASTFILFTCFYNETIHHLMIQSNYSSYNVYSWPRLMLIPGYLLFAAMGDRKKGRYVPLLSLCIMLIALLNVVLVGDQSAYWFNMCLFYFSIAAFTSYYLLTFWRLAPGTKHPALWAPAGRMLDSAMVLLTGALHLSSLSAPVVLGIDIAGVVLVIVLMVAGGDFSLHTPAPEKLPEPVGEGTEREEPSAAPVSFPPKEMPKEPPAAPDPVSLSPEETLAKLRERCGLTPREAEVLRELVLSEDKQTVISQRLSIQVKTLQDYVTRLYRKTGTSSRLGLRNLYDQQRNGN